MSKPQRIKLGVKSATRIGQYIALNRDEDGLYTLRNVRNLQEFFLGNAAAALAVLKEAGRAVRANIKVLGE